MVKGKCKNPTNRSQDHSPSSERSTPTPPSPGHHNTPEKQDPDLKAYLMMMVEDIKKDFNNSFREIQENTAKQVEDLKEETQKFLKELWENTTKQVMELNKTITCLVVFSCNSLRNFCVSSLRFSTGLAVFSCISLSELL